jgi:hypothetical protein
LEDTVSSGHSTKIGRSQEQGAVKNVAFFVALLILTVGISDIIEPSNLVWIAQHALTSGAFYIIAVGRFAFGLILISVAPASREPTVLRILGYLLLVAGIATALMGLMAIDRARAMIEWWMQQGPGVVRLTAVMVVALGGFVTYACAPARRAA